jgi:hypothetical protein
MMQVNIEWAWGCSKIVHACSTDILSDVLNSNGFCPIEGSRLLVAHRGRFLVPDFSLQFHEIKTGDHVVCILKRLPSRDKSQRFLESLSPPHRIVFQPISVTETPETDRCCEEARLGDLTFAHWESNPGFPLVMTDLLRQQEEESNEKQSDGITWLTHLTDSPEICEGPLPTASHYETSLASSVFKNGPDWCSGFVADIADQSIRGNYFDHLKK